MGKPIFIRNDFIYFRPLELSDIENGWHTWINHYEDSYFISGFFPKNKNDLKLFLHSHAYPHSMIFAVCDFNDNYLGNARIANIDWINRSCEFGRFIGSKKVRGQGIGTHVLDLILELVFVRFGLNRIQTKVFVDNEASIRSNTKSGLEIEGTLKSAIFHDGIYKDVIIFGLTREKYLSSKK